MDFLKMNHLRWFEFTCSEDFRALAGVCESIREGTKGVVDQFTDDIIKAAAQIPPDQRSDYFEHADVRERELSDEYPALINQAMFMIVYSKTESLLHRLCHAAYRDGRVQKHPPSTVYVCDSQNYLAAILPQQTVSHPFGWLGLDACRLIRNALAHSNGYVENPDKRNVITQYLAANETDIWINNADVLVLGASAVDKFIAQSESFITVLSQAISGRPLAT